MRRLEDFIGGWRLAREIRHADGTVARFDGEAVWTPTEAGALCHERGRLEMDGQGFEAERRYRWDRDLNVWFEDGRFFHAVPPGGGEAAHWCDPDQYDAAYDFSRWPEWCCTWAVRGPRKDYVMVSRYARLSD